MLSEGHGNNKQIVDKSLKYKLHTEVRSTFEIHPKWTSINGIDFISTSGLYFVLRAVPARPAHRAIRKYLRLGLAPSWRYKILHANTRAIFHTARKAAGISIYIRFVHIWLNESQNCFMIFDNGNGFLSGVTMVTPLKITTLSSHQANLNDCSEHC